jgi:uncharacterized membrane protein/mono/diheme cytochrome c family protein
MPNTALFIGRFHPLLVHLPIGFLTLLALLEIARFLPPFKNAVQSRGLILLATVLATVATITAGLLLSSAGGYDPSLLFWHKWMGITLGCAILVCAFGHFRGQPRLYAGAFAAALLFLAPASHLGGSITHGPNYLFAYAPLWLRPSSAPPVRPISLPAPPSSPANARIYPDLIQPILAQSCVGCHGPDRTSGQLRLDSLQGLQHGGQSGPAFIPRRAADSLIIHRISLPLSDAQHMPPDGKPQPTDDQIQALQWWIDAGAPAGNPAKQSFTTVADLNPSADQLGLVARLLKLPEPGAPPTVPPVPVSDLSSPLSAILSATKVLITPVSVDQPWIIINASLNHAFTDTDLARLAPIVPNIVDLNLASTHITDAAGPILERMTNLKRLRLDHTAITDALLPHLQPLSQLDYLNLCGTPLTDAAVKPLAALPALHHLYLYQTKLTPSAIATLSAAHNDPAKLAHLKQQIAALQSQLNATRVEIIQSIHPATAPTTAPTTAP